VVAVAGGSTARTGSQGRRRSVPERVGSPMQLPEVRQGRHRTAHYSHLSRTIKPKSHITNAPTEHRQCVVQQKQRCCIADPYHQQRENRHVIILCFLFLMFLFCFSILTLVLTDSTSVSNQFNICENYFDTLEQLIQHLLKKC